MHTAAEGLGTRRVDHIATMVLLQSHSLGEFFFFQIKYAMTMTMRMMIITPISPPITPPAIAPASEEACGGGWVGGGDEVGVGDGG